MQGQGRVCMQLIIAAWLILVWVAQGLGVGDLAEVGSLNPWTLNP